MEFISVIRLCANGSAKGNRTKEKENRRKYIASGENARLALALWCRSMAGDGHKQHPQTKIQSLSISKRGYFYLW